MSGEQRSEADELTRWTLKMDGYLEASENGNYCRFHDAKEIIQPLESQLTAARAELGEARDLANVCYSALDALRDVRPDIPGLMLAWWNNVAFPAMEKYQTTRPAGDAERAKGEGA